MFRSHVMGWVVGILIFFGVDVMMHEHHKIMDDSQPYTEAGDNDPDPQSWAQDNLKRHDVADCYEGNPVFVAPGGDLEQC